MAKTYHLSPWRRLVNDLVRGLLRVGLGPPHTYLLTVEGRRTRRVYSTPVTLVEEGGRRWLVAPYGEVAWVRNLRLAGRATLSRGRRVEEISVREIGVDDAAPVLRMYVRRVP